MLDFDALVPRLLGSRSTGWSTFPRRQADFVRAPRTLHADYHGSVRPCRERADIPLSIKATQLASQVNTIIIMSSNSDYVELVSHLKSEGVRVEIAAVPATTSRQLIEAADYFHEITPDDWFTLDVKKKALRTRPAARLATNGKDKSPPPRRTTSTVNRRRRVGYLYITHRV